MTKPQPIPMSLKSILNSLDTDMGFYLKDEDVLKNLRMGVKSSTNNPSSVPNGEIDSPEEANIFYLKCKIAIIKSVIFAGYTVFASLLGTGGMALTIPNIGANIMANPIGVVDGMGVVFMASFFTSLVRQLKLADTEVKTN